MAKEIMAAMLSCSGLTLTEAEKKLLEKANPLGITIFARNYANKEQLRHLIQEIKEVISREDVLIAVDQEGGRVRRLPEPDFRSYISQRSLGSLGKKAPLAVEYHSILIADDLRDLGINWNYAPVLDLVFPETSPVLSNRCFGNDEKQVAELGRIMVDTYKQNSICPCLKHMPGHGRVSLDPHLNLPQLEYSLRELERDFYPFQQLAGSSPAAMTAHVVIKEVDDTFPVTQSAKAIKEIIRGRMGFEGFLISDGIDMKALRGSLSEKVKSSLKAGCDAICYCMGQESGLEEIVASCPSLTDKALERLAAIIKVTKMAPPYQNIEVIAQEYQQLAGKAEVYNVEYDATEVLHRLTKA